MSGEPPETTKGRRWLARLAFVAAVAAATTLVVAAGVRGAVVLVVAGVAGVGAILAGGWWFLTHRGFRRWMAAILLLAAPATVAVVYVGSGLAWVVVASAVLWSGAIAAGRAALTTTGAAGGPAEHDVPSPRRPFLIMNPRSGGGVVGRLGLAAEARALGAEVVLLDRPDADVVHIARRAVEAGADLLGVAGGDGTQALVAGVAAERDVPFMVISAGTRNHFALDLGLDRDDPVGGLAALTDGVEVRIDLGQAGERTFVNNASFGAYAAVVQNPAYRDDKARTALDMLPDLLTGRGGPALRVRAGDATLAGPQAVLVSNNPYTMDDAAGLGRRPRLDAGVLGVLVVALPDAARPARGRRSKAVTQVTVQEAVVDADEPSIPVGIDGEAVTMPTPVRCVIRPEVLRVRVPRRRPGIRPARPTVDWARLRRLALPAGPVARP